MKRIIGLVVIVAVLAAIHHCSASAAPVVAHSDQTAAQLQAIGE